jgi:hypothetical protein
MSEAYDTARNACELGFEDISGQIFRGLLSDARTVFDEDRSLCIVKKDSEDVGSFNVWNKDTGIVGDYHYISKPSGETVVFYKDGDVFSSDDKGFKVTLEELDDGTFEYIDVNSYVRTYSNEGKLVQVTYEGQETTINYDENYKISSITGPLDDVLNFTYSTTEKLTNITYGDKSAIFQYDDNNKLHIVELVTDDIAFEEDSPVLEDLEK